MLPVLVQSWDFNYESLHIQLSGIILSLFAWLEFIWFCHYYKTSFEKSKMHITDKYYVPWSKILKKTYYHILNSLSWKMVSLFILSQGISSSSPSHGGAVGTMLWKVISDKSTCTEKYWNKLSFTKDVRNTLWKACKKKKKKACMKVLWVPCY